VLERFTWFKQSAYCYRGDGITIYIDPWGIPKEDPADVVFITHAHFDHYNPDLEKVRGPKTKIVAPADVARELSGDVTPVRPGQKLTIAGISVQTVPAYNSHPQRLQMHPKANQWVGYVLSLGGQRYYHAGDTDHLPELEQVKAEVAFIPIGGTYTMDASEAAGLARKIAPQIAVPMHYGYVVGTVEDANQFAKAAQPVKVQILKPVEAFPPEPVDE
jgi:L-ascorbate metabolism protein UlaG (beta-lactamase superfamily)